MMRTTRKLVLCVVVTAAVSAPAWAATWQYVGTSGFTTTPAWALDFKRMLFNCITVDAAGNVYVTAANGNNSGTNVGGLTIYSPSGTKLADVDVNAAGFPGAITKMVTGGDGKVYALQNWLQMGWSYNSGVPNRIIRISSDGSITQIWSPGAASDANRIGGMDVAADGNIYWSMNGADNYWKWNFFWRYVVATGAVEEAARYLPPGVNDGQSETHRMFDLVFVGRYDDKTTPVVDWFTLIGGMGGSTWAADAMFWGPAGTDDGRRRAANYGAATTGWGHSWVTATAYDKDLKKLWVGGMSTSGTNPWAGYFSGSSEREQEILSLGSGNWGIRAKNRSTGYFSYRRNTSSAAQTEATLAVAFKVEATDANYQGTLAYVHLNDQSPIPGLCIMGGNFALVNCHDTPVILLPSIAAVDNNWHTAFLYVNKSSNTIRFWWDGVDMYNQSGQTTSAPGVQGAFFGATCMRPYSWSKTLTCTVTYDWVGYDEALNAPPGSWKTQAIGAGGLLASYLDGSFCPSQFVQSSVMTRWDPDPNVFTPTDALFDSPFSPQTGILQNVNWHANGNDPASTNVPNGGDYWISALAIQPATHAAWMSWGNARIGASDVPGAGPSKDIDVYAPGSAATYAAIGGVYAMGPDELSGPSWSEGVPQQAHPAKPNDASQVVAITAGFKSMYALTLDLVTGEYNLFKTPTDVCNAPPQDADDDGDVDLTDFGAFQACFNGPNRPWPTALPMKVCACQDVNDDGDVDLSDFGTFQGCFNGPNRPPACAG